MENYFYESLLRGIGGLVFRKYGAVQTSILGDEENTFIRIIIYNAPRAIISMLDDVSKKEREVLVKEYDISNVDFTNELSVYEKLNTITSEFEIALQ